MFTAFIASPPPALPLPLSLKVNLRASYIQTQKRTKAPSWKAKAWHLNWNKIIQTFTSPNVYKFHFIDLYFHNWLSWQSYFIFTEVRKIQRGKVSEQSGLQHSSTLSWCCKIWDVSKTKRFDAIPCEMLSPGMDPSDVLACWEPWSWLPKPPSFVQPWHHLLEGLFLHDQKETTAGNVTINQPQHQGKGWELTTKARFSPIETTPVHSKRQHLRHFLNRTKAASSILTGRNASRGLQYAPPA